jgi:hypothetical protein
MTSGSAKSVSVKKDLEMVLDEPRNKLGVGARGPCRQNLSASTSWRREVAAAALAMS